jgi:hypothetical protein
MQHCTLQDMLDELLEDPEEILVTAKSKRCALYGRLTEAEMHLLTGDFSGTIKEREIEARRILKNTN